MYPLRVKSWTRQNAVLCLLLNENDPARNYFNAAIIYSHPDTSFTEPKETILSTNQL